MENFNDCLFLKGRKKVIECLSQLDEVLMIVGKGFDPRTCNAIEALITNGIHINTAWLIDYNDRSYSNDEKNNEFRSNINVRSFEEICKDIIHKTLNVPTYKNDDGKRVLVISESVKNFLKKEYISEFKNIIIDISAMPRAVSFSIIKWIRTIKNESQRLYIIVSENSEYDDSINPIIVEGSAEYLQGFKTFSLTMESDGDDTIWLPALGINGKEAFNIIADYLKPVEICPIVPFPAVNARKSENILRNYGQILFQEQNIEKRNIIYVPENFPLIVYKKLYDTVKYYEKALNKDNNRSIRYAFSSQSSKLIDMGVLLTILSLEKEYIKAGVVIVENKGYSPKQTYNGDNEELCCICLDNSEFDW